MKTIVMSILTALIGVLLALLHLLSRILQAAGAVIQDAYSWSQTFAIGRCLRQAVVLSARITTSPFRSVKNEITSEWPLFSEVHSDSWDIFDRSVHQPTLHAAMEADLRYTARFHYDTRDLTWVDRNSHDMDNQNYGYWDIGEKKPSSYDWSDVMSRQRDTHSIPGEELVGSDQIMSDWRKMVGWVKFKAKQIQTNMVIQMADRLPGTIDTPDPGTIETISATRLIFVIDDKTIKYGSLRRLWR